MHRDCCESPARLRHGLNMQRQHRKLAKPDLVAEGSHQKTKNASEKKWQTVTAKQRWKHWFIQRHNHWLSAWTCCDWSAAHSCAARAKSWGAINCVLYWVLGKLLVFRWLRSLFFVSLPILATCIYCVNWPLEVLNLCGAEFFVLTWSMKKKRY